jgi:KUP system potassium uptake protein
VGALAVAPFLVVELVFLASNFVKLFDGGFVPLMLAALLATGMVTWARGTRILTAKAHRESVPLRDLARMLSKSSPHRVPGTAIFLTSDPDVAPVALTHNLKHNKVLHEKNIILTVRTSDLPRVPIDQRIEMEQISDDFTLVTLTFGFMETPNVPVALNQCRRRGLSFDIMSTSFFLGRRTIKASAHSGMPLWQDRLYIALANAAANATDFFRIPAGRVVEMGTQILV